VKFDGSVNNGFITPHGPIIVPDGPTYLRVSLFDAFVNPASDLDLHLYYIVGDVSTEVGYSGSGTSAEEINLVNPPAGEYWVGVEGYATANPTTYTLFSWLLGTADEGNVTVSAPTTAVIGQTGTIGLTFNGLTPGVKYLGSVVYGGIAGLPNPTIVRVDP